MKKLNELSKKIYITGHRKIQLGNSLVPILIALAISAVASVAFLDQGSKLTEKNKVLAAQFELTAILEEWNSRKSSLGVSSITHLNFPSATFRKNVYNAKVQYFPTYHGDSKVLIYYGFKSINECEAARVIMSNMRGVSSTRGAMCLTNKHYPGEYQIYTTLE